MLWMLTIAYAMEPGASRGELQPDCACMEVQPGAHADKHSRTWRAFPQATHLEHLELANKPLLSAVMSDRSRVSLAERDAVVDVASQIVTVTPLDLLDQGTGYACKHLSIPPGEPRDLEIYLVDTTELRVDAAAVGRALRQRAAGLQRCLGTAGAAELAVTVKPSGKVGLKDIDATASIGDCVAGELKGLKAAVEQKAGGDQRWGLRTP